jgi:hypothetical protein
MSQPINICPASHKKPLRKNQTEKPDLTAGADVEPEYAVSKIICATGRKMKRADHQQKTRPTIQMKQKGNRDRQKYKPDCLALKNL